MSAWRARERERERAACLFLLLFLLLVVVGSHSHKLACRRVVHSKIVKLDDHPGEVSRGTKPLYEPGLGLYANCDAMVLLLLLLAVEQRLKGGGQEFDWRCGGGR